MRGLRQDLSQKHHSRLVRPRNQPTSIGWPGLPSRRFPKISMRHYSHCSLARTFAAGNGSTASTISRLESEPSSNRVKEIAPCFVYPTVRHWQSRQTARSEERRVGKSVDSGE